MTSFVTRNRATCCAVAVASAVVLSSCSSDDGGSPPAETATASAAPTTSAAPAPTGPFGAGCAALPPEAIAAMADDPVVLAASTTPLLSTLVIAVQTANLVDAFNTTPDITVLAPANPAFEAVPADALNALLVDTARLTALLTHHVIPGRLTPGELAGTHTTLSGDEVTVEGEGESFTVSADQTVVGAAPASVVCGNVQTANATVYIVDQVLTPTT